MAPPRKDTEAVTVRVSLKTLKIVDDRRRLVEDMPSRPEFIRRALLEWLAANPAT